MKQIYPITKTQKNQAIKQKTRKAAKSDGTFYEVQTRKNAQSKRLAYANCLCNHPKLR